MDESLPFIANNLPPFRFFVRLLRIRSVNIMHQLISALHPVGRIVFKSDDLVRDRRLNRAALTILFRGRVNYLQMSSNYARGQCTRIISTHV